MVVNNRECWFVLQTQSYSGRFLWGELSLSRARVAVNFPEYRGTWWLLVCLAILYASASSERIEVGMNDCCMLIITIDDYPVRRSLATAYHGPVLLISMTIGRPGVWFLSQRDLLNAKQQPFNIELRWHVYFILYMHFHAFPWIKNTCNEWRASLSMMRPSGKMEIT